MGRSIVILASLVLMLTIPAAATAPTAIVATVNATPYDAVFSIDGQTVDVAPGINRKVSNNEFSLWRLTPDRWHTLSVVTSAGYVDGNPDDRSTWDDHVLQRCSVRIKPKAGDDYILAPSLPRETGDCPLRKFDHESAGDLND
jgi:hypothetical protein